MRWLIPLCVLAACVAGTGLAQEAEGQGYAEEPVVVERVIWPVLIEATKRSRESGICDRLGPADIILTEDGEPRPLKTLSKRPVEPHGQAGVGPIHALLIDTSISMRISERLEHAKEAAIRYIEQLPADERVLVATFDDSLILISPPTLDRAGLEEAIRKTEPGNNTALWDALTELIRYLEGFPDQKTVVLLSDGEDSSSMGDLESWEILERFGARPDLSIFPIGIDLGSHQGSHEFRSVLKRMASSTGGMFFETADGVGVDKGFERLRKHLERRFFVTYEPLLPGEGGGRQALDARKGERRVRVSARKGTPCKVSSAGPPTRFGAPRREAPELPPADAAKVASAIAATGECLKLSSRWSVTHEMRLPKPAGWPGVSDEPAAVYVLDPPGFLAVRTPDVVVERGVLYSRKAYEKAGRYRLTLDRKPRVDTRTVAIEVPEFDYLRREIRGPDEVLMHLLQNDRCPGRGARLHPLFVHGKTFLEIREFIAHVLFQHYPAYRDWARERLIVDAGPRADALLSEIEASHSLSVERLAGIRSTLVAKAATPEREGPQRFLAEWLGDIPARDAVQSLEARLARALLDPQGRANEEALAEHVERSGFGVFNAWFPPANEVRVLAPLLPAYDPARNVVGFYRIILPRPRSGAPPLDPIPPQAFGLRTVRTLLDAGVWDSDQAGGLRLDRVNNLVPDEAHHNALAQQLKRLQLHNPDRRVKMHGVVLDFADHEIEGAFLELTAVFDGDDTTPKQLSGCLVGDASGAMDGLLNRLLQHDTYRQLSCDAKDNADDKRLRRYPSLR